jgi:hypothetical protein
MLSVALAVPADRVEMPSVVPAVRAAGAAGVVML